MPHIDYNHWHPCAFGDMALVHKKFQAPAVALAGEKVDDGVAGDLAGHPRRRQVV